jgi:hypothetical protein
VGCGLRACAVMLVVLVKQVPPTGTILTVSYTISRRTQIVSFASSASMEA